MVLLLDLALTGDQAVELKPPIALIRLLSFAVRLLGAGPKASDQMTQTVVELLVSVIEVCLVLEGQFTFNQMGGQMDPSLDDPSAQMEEVRPLGRGRVIEPVAESVQGNNLITDHIRLLGNQLPNESVSHVIADILAGPRGLDQRKAGHAARFLQNTFGDQVIIVFIPRPEQLTDLDRNLGAEVGEVEKLRGNGVVVLSVGSDPGAKPNNLTQPFAVVELADQTLIHARIDADYPGATFVEFVHGPFPNREVADPHNHVMLAGGFAQFQPGHDLRVERGKAKLAIADDPFTAVAVAGFI